MYPEHTLARKGIVALAALLMLGAAASSASAEPRYTKIGPVTNEDVARARVPPVEAQAAAPASVATTESEVIALRQQVNELTKRLASFEDRISVFERLKQEQPDAASARSPRLARPRARGAGTTSRPRNGTRITRRRSGSGSRTGAVDAKWAGRPVGPGSRDASLAAPRRGQQANGSVSLVNYLSPPRPVTC